MKKELPILSIRLPRSIITALDRQAKAEGTDRSDLVRRIICHYLEMSEPVILQGFAEMPRLKLLKVSSKGGKTSKK